MKHKDAVHKPAAIIPNKHLNTDNISNNSKLFLTEMDFFLGYKHWKGYSELSGWLSYISQF